MRRNSQDVVDLCNNTTVSCEHDRSLNQNSQPAQLQILNQKLDSLKDSFGKISKFLQSKMIPQNSNLQQVQSKSNDALFNRLDYIININRSIYDDIHSLVLNQPKRVSDKDDSKQIESTFTLYSNQEKGSNQIQIIQKGVSQVIVAAKEQDDSESNQMPSKTIHNEKMDNQIVKTVSLTQNMKTKDQIKQEIAQDYLKKQGNQRMFSEFVGNFYHKLAEHYFNQYKSGKLSFDDMKIGFSFELVREVVELVKKWHQSYYGSQNINEVNYYNRVAETRICFHAELNIALKDTLKFLLYKYPPSRRKIIDTQLLQKIKQTKQFSVVKYDMLRNAEMDIGLKNNQTLFVKEIKMWINKLIIQSSKQFPKFRQTMKRIFLGGEGSLDGEIENQIDYTIGMKIPEGASLYTEQELDNPSPQIKNPEIQRILMKWCQQLNSYFTDPTKMIYNNKYGFKSTRLSIPIRLPKSKLDILVENLNNAYDRIIRQTKQLNRIQQGTMFNDLLDLTIGGISGGFQFLSEKEMIVLKYCEHMNETLKHMVFKYLNYYLTELSKIRTFYDTSKQQSSINMITFSIMDLLRCRCVGTKAEIYRIYNQILENKEYFQIIRIKNKLNEPTRDILINLKLRESFLICEVQLSLGQSIQQVNNHFCHYLYELERSRFGPMYECASQISNLDPRMLYVASQYKLQLIGSKYCKQSLKDKTETRGDSIYCFHGHEPTPMKLTPNVQPFCCLLCGNFINSYTICLDLAKCPKCFLNICSICIVEKYSTNKDFKKKFISKHIECQLGNIFFQPLSQHCITHPSNFKTTVQKYLENHEYVMHMIVDGLRNNPVIYKKYKNIRIPAFFTIPEAQSNMKESYVCWNYVSTPNQHQVARLDQLDNYKKYHMILQWAELEHLLKQRGIKEVVCIFNQQEKMVLIIDIVQTDEQIQKFRTKSQIDTIIDTCNKSIDLQLQLTSSNLDSLDKLQSIQFKNQMISLNLWENNISSIDQLSEYKSLQYLVLRQNKIKSIQPILDLQNLETLQLASNRISGQFPKLNYPRLKLLDCGDNDITSIKNLSTSELPSLILLKIYGTQITEMPQLPFPTLHVLSIQKNFIQDLQNIRLSKLNKLIKLVGSHNLIKKLPTLHMESIAQMFFNYNKIQSITEFASSRCPKLMIVDLSHNLIKGTAPQLEFFNNLTRLNLSHSMLSSVDVNNFKSCSLQRLDMSYNQIQGVFPTFTSSSLKYINASYNNFSSMSDNHLLKLSAVQYVDLSHNKIHGKLCPIALMKIQYFNLSYNEITSLDGIQHWKLPRVTTILLNNNNIQGDIRKIYMERLKVLDLSFNNVSGISFFEYLHLVPHLEKVYVGNNQRIVLEEINQNYLKFVEFEDNKNESYYVNDIFM